MLYAMLAGCATLILVLAVPRAVEASRLARLFRAQEEWAEMMDRHALPPSAIPPGGPVALDSIAAQLQRGCLPWMPNHLEFQWRNRDRRHPGRCPAGNKRSFHSSWPPRSRPRLPGTGQATRTSGQPGTRFRRVSQKLNHSRWSPRVASAYRTTFRWVVMCTIRQRPARSHWLSRLHLWYLTTPCPQMDPRLLVTRLGNHLCHLCPANTRCFDPGDVANCQAVSGE